MNYVGMKCPVCGKTFTADDDIVVCPQCGAPYHRECYARVGKCIYADRHGTPDAWKPPQPEADEETRRCPRCGAVNRNSALYCVHCGMPLSDEDQPPHDNPFPAQNPNASNRQNGAGIPPQGGNMPPNYGYQGQPFFFLVDPLGGVNPAESVDGVPAGDIAKYVQENTQYYVPVFANISRFGRSRFNFSAFFFQGIWMLYRKLYKVGTLITVLQGILMVGYNYIMRYYWMPLYQRLLSAIGVTNVMSAYALTAEQKTNLMHQYYVLPLQQQFLLIAPGLLLLAGFAIMLICGFSGNRLYLKHCLASVNRIHSEVSEPVDFSIRLQQEGGVNSSLGVVFLICFLLIFFFIGS